MKKLLSLALVLAMVLAMSTTAFATEITGNSGSTDITYTYEAPVDSYVVTIPDSMPVGTGATVSVSDIVLAVGYQLTVSVSSTQYDNGWKLKNNGDTLNYTLKIDNTDVANNGTVLTAKNGNEVSKTLVTAVPKGQKPKYSGSYTDTLTFSVSVVDTSINATSMTTDQLKAAVAAELEAGKTDITVAMTSTPEVAMFTAIRNALINTDGVEDGSINLTLKGVTVIPDHTAVGSNPSFVFGPDGTIDEYNPECVTQLASVYLPDVLSIGTNAFGYCKNLTSITAPKLQTVGTGAFNHAGLTSVNLPEVTTIGNYAFGNCKSLTTVEFPKATTIVNEAFYECSSLTTAKLPSATSIGDMAFHSTNITHLELTADDSISIHEDALGYPNTFSADIDLVLNKNKQSEVTDGTTWNGFTFKSITFAD